MKSLVNDVLDKRNRWLVNVILIVAVMAFVGFSLALPLSAWFENQQSPAGHSPYGGGSQEASGQSDLQDQVRGYQLVLEREPNNQTALEGLLIAQLQLNDIEGAIKPLETLSELNPEETRYSVLLGQAKQQVGDQEGAAQVYRGVLSTQPGNIDALRGLVSLLIEEQRPEASIGLLQDTLKTADDVNQIQANSVDVTAVQLLLGEVYVELNRDAEALAIYDEAIKNSASDFRPLLSKALLLQEQGNAEEASGLFTSAAALAPPQYKDEINRLATASSVNDADEGTADSGLAADNEGDTVPAPETGENEVVDDAAGASENDSAAQE